MKPYQPTDVVRDTEVNSIELHLSAHVEDFLKRYGRRIKAAGGHYSECRGYASTRYVDVPVGGNLTPEQDASNRALVNELMQFPDRKDKCTVIFRGSMYERQDGSPIVQYGKTFADACEGYRFAIERRANEPRPPGWGALRGLPDEVRAYRAEQARQEEEHRREQSRANLMLDGSDYNLSSADEVEVRRVLGWDKLERVNTNTEKP